MCKSGRKSILNKSIPMQAQANNLRLCHKYNELEIFCPSELMLIPKIIPFIFIAAWQKNAQHGLKGECILVPTELKKIQKLLPRSSSEKYLISLAWKLRLRGNIAVCKQIIQPTAANKTLKKA